MNWLDLLVPRDAGELWTAAAAVATVTAVWFAYLAARSAAVALHLELTPVVNLKRSGDAAELRHVGRGVAVNVMLTSADGRWVTLIDTLRPDETSAVSRNDLQDDDGFYA